MMHALLLVLAISTVSAGPLDADLDADLSVDTFLQDGLAEDPDFATKTLSDVVSFAQAREFVKKKNDSAECNTTMKALEDVVKAHVADEQTRVNNMENGTICLEKGKDAVSTAVAAKTAADLALKEAKKNLADAKGKKITWTYTFESVAGETDCGYRKSPEFLKTKALVKKLTSSVDEAKGSLKQAIANLETENKLAAKSKLKCQCDTYTKMQKEIKASKALIKNDNAMGWKKAKHLACVLAGTSQDQCDITGMPTVTAPTLASGVDQSACATSAPTPSPATPVPSPTPVTLAPTLMPDCADFAISSLSSYSSSSCSAINMRSDDGGVVFMGGEKYVYYDTDSGSERFTYGSSSSSRSLSRPNGSTRSKFGSVFSDLKLGHMYRLTTSETSSYSGSPVSKGSSFTHLQCLNADGSVLGSAALSSSQTMGNPYLLYEGYGYAAFVDSANKWKVLELNRCAGPVKVASIGANTGAPMGGNLRHYPCEQKRSNGILENNGHSFSIVYPCGNSANTKGTFCRKALPSGTPAKAFSLGSTYHSDTCSLALDVRAKTYFWHSESTNNMNEPLYACPMVPSVVPRKCMGPITSAMSQSNQ